MPFALNNRHRLPRLTALVLFLGCVALVGSAQQPPVEVEDPKGTVKKKIIVDDDPIPTKKGPVTPVGNPPDAKLDELVKAGEEARTPGLKALFAKYTVPFDRLNDSGNDLRVKPIPFRKNEWPSDGSKEFDVIPLDATGKPRDARRVRVGAVRSSDPFETLVPKEVDELLKAKGDPLAITDNLAASEKLLAAAIRFHDYARERQIRKGKTWDEVRDPLVTKLRDVRLDMLRTAIAAKDAVRIRDAGTRLMNAYPKDAVVAREVAAARVGEAVQLLKSASHADHIRAKELLDEFEGRFPGAGAEAVADIRRQLREMAVKAFTRAKDKKGVGDLTAARDELARAASLDPTVEGIRELQRELRTGYPILQVGVRQYPINMSPATARVDSEKQVVELLFEGLLEEVPEESGAVRYRAGAAQALPSAIPGGREFLLRAFDRDASGRPGFDSHDVVTTMKLLGNRSDTWQAYPLPWLGVPAPKDNSAVRIPFALGHPDPRAVLTFKMLPARWMTENGKQVDDAGFAEKPFGTGPFKLYSNPQPMGKAPREMVFVDNPGYSRWRDRTGLPHIREVRMIEAGKLDPVEAFRTDKLHILTDIPTADIPKFTGPNGIGDRVQVVTSVSNRRVHILAINLQRSYLQSKPLRQGISMAIDREEILRDVFRAAQPHFHKAMTGPYPTNSWANPKTVGSLPALVNRDLAVARLKTYLSGTAPKTDLELAFPDDDPRAEEACRKIKAQIEGLTKDGPGGRKLVINLVGIPTRDLITRVEAEHRYDLAYIPFDYPDDWHPYGLGAALDPLATARGGRNWFSFLMRDTNPDEQDQRLGQLLNELRGYRDFAGQLLPRAIEAGKLFNDSVPFVPLWQLDRHMVVHNSVKVFVDDKLEPVSPRLLNPTTLFQNVARWRLE
ncbi:MAG: hypothetical protein C0467_01280 [Planctomycetaceae bacterium]|nr:hypothetical protein [Planctomycetaceae bacterium]